MTQFIIISIGATLVIKSLWVMMKKEQKQPAGWVHNNTCNQATVDAALLRVMVEQ